MKGTTLIDDIDINFESVKEELAKLNCFKSMGPDAIHPKVLKSLSEGISFVDVVVKLFRNCIDTGTIPVFQVCGKWLMLLHFIRMALRRSH